MNKAVACKLTPTPEQQAALLETLDLFADACNTALKVAQEAGKHRAYDIHHICYYNIKEATGLTSNYVIRAIGRVAGSFGRKNPPKEFKPTSLDLDKDLIRFIPFTETVSIATAQGLQKIKLQLGNYQRHLLKAQAPKAGVLAYDQKRKSFHIHFSCVADVNAAHNIAAQGALVVGLTDAVNRPETAVVQTQNHAFLPTSKPPDLTSGN